VKVDDQKLAIGTLSNERVPLARPRKMTRLPCL